MKKWTKYILPLLFVVSYNVSFAQGYWDNIDGRASTLGLDHGYTLVPAGNFNLKLVNASQTVAGLSPTATPDFDFTPGDRLALRDKDSLYHLGDINFRIRQDGGEWKGYSTAWHRAPIVPLSVSGTILAGADLANSLPKDIPLQINRYYEVSGGDLILRFEISNTSKAVVEFGALGIPMIFNNILEGKTLEETHAQNVFFDPYIGSDGGYLEVKRLNGKGPALLVLPETNMAFEAYRPLLDDPTRKSVVFEGFHEWMSLSKAYAESEWKEAEQWNTPTALMLAPGATTNVALRLTLSDNIKGIEQTLIAKEKPVAIGVPGYVIPQDVHARLFLKYKTGIKSIEVTPEGALEVKPVVGDTGGYTQLEVQGKLWGRARLKITYNDDLQQTVHYKIVKAEREIVKDYGRFLTTEQWFDDPSDLFHRTPSAISYDYEQKEQVVQDSRAWIAGLSDEGGAGSWLGAVMKQLILPERKEIQKLQHFIDSTLWGHIQYVAGKNKYGVRKSLFYYEPEKMPIGTYRDDINFKTWAAWNKEEADKPGRSYNYPHVAAAHWVMYRLARYHEGLVDNRAWDWYLTNAYHTAVAMTELAPYYAQFGQMEGTIFLLILEDLKREGFEAEAKDLEAKMKSRAEHWRTLAYPFGSEMPWDSTGQEEVYMWSDYFGFDEKATITLNAILAYMPIMPHWAYNGSARRYWDFLYAGKLSRVERQLHHYGSALNAIPVLKAYRNNPETYLLRVGYGGLLGGISNITQDGFGPAAFHSFPETLKVDGLSGDYGSGFFGYAVNTATYITKDTDLGWLAFGGNLSEEGKSIEVHITTAGRNRIFLAPKKLWLTLDSGTFNKISYDEKSGAVSVELAPKDAYTPYAYLRLDQEVVLPYDKVRGAYKIPLTDKAFTIQL